MPYGCKKALQECPNFTIHIVIIIIVINNFSFVGMIQHFKILQIVFRAEKLIKANYKPGKRKFLKDTFQ